MGRNSTTMSKTCLLIGIAYLFIVSPVMGANRQLGQETVFDITKYDAKADDTTDNAIPIIDTWLAACKSTGPAKVVVPKGEFVAGEIVLKGPCPDAKPMIFEILGSILAIKNASAYPGEAWIKVSKVDDITFTGGGNINGRAADAWKLASEKDRLPVSLMFHRVGNLELKRLNVIDSMGFHTKVTDSHDVTVFDMTMTAPEDSPNTDGIHISSTTKMRIKDSVIATGDDCVSIGEGSVDIEVVRVTCGPGHGLSIGSLGKRPDELPVSNIIIKNCTIKGATNGARIKSFHNTKKLAASNIVFEDIVMIDVKNPILIDQHYFSKKIAGHSNVKITDAHFRNIRGTTISPVAINLNCSKAVPCEGVKLENIDLTPSESVKEPLTSSCEFATLTSKGKMVPPAPTC